MAAEKKNPSQDKKTALESALKQIEKQYDKGWTVKIDGKKVKTKALGKAFLTVKVPEGKHKVSLTYVSFGFKEGAILSVAGFVIFILITTFFRRKKKAAVKEI